jgi:AraC family transcriptional regulator of adaptative response/methylated-DNA-[protein]-cysteine methyltransferase
MTSNVFEAGTDEARWLAVSERNSAVDGAFVYAVRTTGVYCRPSCPSRRAKRANVAFYEANHDAEAAGFRPCKRCRPNEISAAGLNAIAVATACERLESAEVEPSLDDLAKAAGFSKFYFQRVFKEIVGMTPKQYARGARAPRLRTAVKAAPSVTTAAFDSGHESMRRFYDNALVAFGMAPKTFRAGAAGEVIVYASASTSLGIATAAFTGSGVCAVRITDSSETGESELRQLFPAALLIPGTGDFETLVQRVAATIEEPVQATDLPLDIRGTAFQQRVWNALRQIPIGTTSTYSEIVAIIGAPSSQRAVGRACGANPAAVLVPCHRVLRADGGLAGYRWGVERKRTLLRRERAR